MYLANSGNKILHSRGRQKWRTTEDQENADPLNNIFQRVSRLNGGNPCQLVTGIPRHTLDTCHYMSMYI